MPASKPRFLKLMALIAAVVLAFAISTHPNTALAHQTTGDARKPIPALQDSGKIISDTGFRPGANGFGFQNYGNDAGIENLTPAEMRTLFGDQVCEQLDGDTCLLTSTAQAQMDKFNEDMANGHCEGMATLSLLLFQNKVKVSDLGADSTPTLKFEGNQPLQREIARWFATQLVDPTYASKVKFIDDKITPSQAVDLLVTAISSGSETYTVSIFKRGYKDGHAVTPYAVTDQGNGIVHIMIYDNNHPNEERFIEVDRNANTWKYAASVNPSVPQSVFEGDADSKTLLLVPMSVRLGEQKCQFCAQGSSKLNGLALAAPEYNEVMLTSTAEDNQADLLITDDQGRRLGYQNGQFFSEIPGALFDPITSDDLWKDDPEPIYNIPVGIHFTITLDGSQLTQPETANVSLIGPGYDLVVDDIKLQPGKSDKLILSPDGTKLTYQPSGSEAPDIIVGFDHPGNDYSFLVKGFDLDAGSAVNIGLQLDQGRLSINTSGGKTPAVYALEVDRISKTGEETFSHDGIQLDPGATIYVDFSKWDGKGDLNIEVDQHSDGQIDQSISEANQKK